MEACLEEISVSDPERVRSIHRDYIAAGARVIETNSFGANAARLARFGFEDRVAEIKKAAARIAVEAARGEEVCVAGSVGPLGLSALDAENAESTEQNAFTTRSRRYWMAASISFFWRPLWTTRRWRS